MVQACFESQSRLKICRISSIPLCSCLDCTKFKSWLLPFIFALIHQSYHLTMCILKYWLHKKISGHTGSVLQWSTVIHIGLVVDDWDKSGFPESANTSSLPVITQPVFHTPTVSLISAVGMLSQLCTWVLAGLCGLKIFWEFCKTITVMFSV